MYLNFWGRKRCWNDLEQPAMLTRKFEDGKSADLPSSSVDQDIVKRKTNRLRRQNTAIHKLANVSWGRNKWQMLEFLPYNQNQLFHKFFPSVFLIEVRQNRLLLLLITLGYLKDAPPPLISFLKIFHPGHSYCTPSRLLIFGTIFFWNSHFLPLLMLLSSIFIPTGHSYSNRLPALVIKLWNFYRSPA